MVPVAVDEDVAVDESVAVLDPERAVEESVAEVELDVIAADAGANATEVELVPAVTVEEEESVGEAVDVAEGDEKVIVVDTSVALAELVVEVEAEVDESAEDGDDDGPARRSSEAA